MGKYLKLSPPKRGTKITVAKNGQLQVPDDPVVPCVIGDGVATALWRPVQEVLGVAVERCYANAKRLEWFDVPAGERAVDLYGPGQQLPEDTVRAIQEYKVCLKGQLTTPPGAAAGLDDTLREQLELFAHVQPIRYLDGIPSPLKAPHAVDLVVFREYTEDVYCELEWRKGSPEAKQLITYLNDDLAKKLNKQVRPDSSLGIKPISATATKRLIRLAIEFAIKHKRRSVTLVHKGSLLKQTEGLFREWGYEIARKEFAEWTVTEQQVVEEFHGEVPRGRVLIKEYLASQMLQQLLVSPEEFDVVATTNLNGHFLGSTAAAAVGTAGLVPTAYVGAKAAMFEAAQSARGGGPDELNPTSVLLAGVMLFEHLGWRDSAELVTHAIIKTMADGTVTPDVARRLGDIRPVGPREFCDAVVANFEEVRKSRVRQAIKRSTTGLAGLAL
jgi:isocitrate dehydrogenase